MIKQYRMTILLAFVVAEVVTACSGQTSLTSVPTGSTQSSTQAPRTTQPSTSVASSTQKSTAIPPLVTEITASTATPAASSTSSAQIPTQVPRFTHPTEITNPFYPVSLIGQSISQGTEGGRLFRTEVTLLSDTKTITWDGQQTETRVSQYVAYVDGKLAEVAYDSFAQADDGSVYTLGADVTHYQDGVVTDHRGSWLAGKDGALPTLIMPTHPQVGQVFNPENLPGTATATAEVVNLNEKATTPGGPISNALLIKETGKDGTIEYKVNAANYGVVESRAEDKQASLVWLNRTDAKSRPVPEPLATLEAQAEDIMDVAPGGSWEHVTADVAAMVNAWQAYQTRAADEAPQPFRGALTAALDRLQKASAAKAAAGTLQAANDVSAAVADLFTVYRPATPTDLGRLDVLERQVVLDAGAKDSAAIADSLAKINAIWTRLKPVILAHNGSTAATQFENSLATQQKALDAGELSALTAEANDGLELIDVLERLF